jgi:hypothetical protein
MSAQLGLVLVALVGGIMLEASVHSMYQDANYTGPLAGWSVLGDFPLVIALTLLITSLVRSGSRKAPWPLGLRC